MHQAGGDPSLQEAGKDGRFRVVKGAVQDGACRHERTERWDVGQHFEYELLDLSWKA